MRASSIIKALSAIALAGLAAGAAYAAPGIPTDGGILFQDAVTPGMEKVEALHNIVLWLVIGIVAFVLALMVYICIRFREKANPVPSKTSHNTLLEVVWTAVPVIVVLGLMLGAAPVLYYLDEIPESDMTVKVVGNQWNWDYSYPDHGDFEFNSSVASKDDLDGAPYLLKTTEPMVVPVGKTVRVLVTANDVLHAWAVPSFAVKIDAMPGRINETWFRVDQLGTYYGQCSEICGLDHYNMPVEVKVVSEAEFDAWVLEKNPSYVKNATDVTREASVQN